jgi:2-keto-4-pentenoate hydratase/2-oxohepta-3-ene-1,7-dioic acid hydratase in catechol pathway
MKTTRRSVLTAAVAAAGLGAAQAQSPVTRYVRFRKGSTTAYGILEGDTVTQLQGDLFANPKPTNNRSKLSEVKLLYPTNPPKVLAVGLNYKSHLGDRPAPPRAEMFYKPTTCLQHPDDPIVIPKGAKNVHFEGELVLVIGKRASRISVADAPSVIFGVTCGNDVSERDWQGGADKDLQWWRAKGADTFGPLGPSIVTGLNYGNLLLQTRLNGKVMQKQVTSDLIYGPAQIVSFISDYVTLTPGDVIYTGTPGATSKMNPGDVCEIDIEGIGVLRNKIAAA